FFSSRRRHTSSYGDWSSDVCSSDLGAHAPRVPITAPRRNSFFHSTKESCWRGANGSTRGRVRSPKLNNRSGPASDESSQGEGFRSGCVDTIVNDVKFFLNKIRQWWISPRELSRKRRSAPTRRATGR